MLGGHESGTIENTKVRIYADEFTPINEDTIPTGEIRKVEHTPMDFREWKKIKNDLYAEDEQLEKGKGYDHNFVIRNKDCGFRKMAEALDEEQGIKMEVYSDLPEVSVSKSQFLLFSRHGSPFLMNYPSFPKIVQERLIAFVKAPFLRLPFVWSLVYPCLHC